MVDVNTIIGDPVMLGSDTVIVPVSRVCLGFLSGGGELYGKAPHQPVTALGEEEKKLPFAGASVAGLNLTPIAFLAVTNGTVRVLPAHYNSTLDRIIELVPETFSQVEKAVKEMCERKRQSEAQNENPENAEHTGA